MKHHIKSECYKFIHSPLLLLHILVPLFGALLFVGYFAVSSWSEDNQVSAFIQSLVVTFPVLVGIITGLSCEFEQNAGSFQLILQTKTAKCVPHICKLMVLVMFGLLSAFFTMLLFYSGFAYLGYSNFGALFFVNTATSMMFSMLPLYLLSYGISFVCGKGMSIGLGIVGGLLSALLLTGLGDATWWYIPWGIAARFSLLCSSLNFGAQSEQIHRAMIVLLLFMMIFTALFILVFSRWEGRKSED